MKKDYKYFEALIEKYFQTHSFPTFDTDKRIEFHKEYPLFMFAPQTIKYQEMVDISNICGDNWAFDTIEMRGSYPQYSKLVSLLCGFTSTNNYYYQNKQIPPIPLVKIMGSYYMEEGNHRLYLSKMMGRRTIRADVVDVNYEDFLKDSFIKQDYNYWYIVYNNTVYEVDEIEANNYTLLKAKMRKDGD